MFQPGGRVRDYEIVDKVKSGGMATLYLARRDGARGFTRPVGIKVIHPHLSADPEFVQMFVDEAVLSSRLIHPNIVHVEEFGEEEGHFFLVMEYVDGCSLSELMRFLRRKRKRLKPPLAVHIAMKVADGLHAAHEATDENDQKLNVVHRDVGPANILLSRKGQIKTIDFGIAKSKVRTKETDTSSLKGKIRYMSPEQANGQNLDRRTDVYSLGLVLWELLTSRRIFRAETDIALLDKVRNPQIPDIAQYLKSSPELAKVVTRALAKDPAERFESALEFRRALATCCPEALRVESSDIGTLVRNVPTEQLRATATTQHTPPSQVSLPSAVASPVSYPLDASNPSGSMPMAPSVSTAHTEQLVGTETRKPSPWLIGGGVVAAVAALAVIALMMGGNEPELEPGSTERLVEPVAPVTGVAAPPSLATERAPDLEPPPLAPTAADPPPAVGSRYRPSTGMSEMGNERRPATRAARPEAQPPQTVTQPSAAPAQNPAPATMREGVRVRGALLAGEDSLDSAPRSAGMQNATMGDSVRVGGALLATDE